MKIIGLTGGVATGKTTVAQLLGDRGAVVIDADEVAHEVEQQGGAAYGEIVRRFGADVLRPDGSIDRAQLGAVVFADADARRDLERITHPPIRARMGELVARAADTNPPLIAVDVPLLFETGGEDRFGGVMLVYAPEAQQVRRLMRRNGMTESEARQRIAAQLPIDSKRERATWVIDNSGSAGATRRQVEHWWSEQVG